MFPKIQQYQQEMEFCHTGRKYQRPEWAGEKNWNSLEYFMCECMACTLFPTTNVIATVKLLILEIVGNKKNEGLA